MVFNGVAPSMAELAQLYIGLDFVFKATYLLTAPREYLIKRASDRNMAPKPASPAVFRAECNIEVPVGTRFSCEDINFVVTARMESADTESAKSHEVTCEKAGALGNGYTGQLIPVEYVNGLTRAELVELLVPGEDDEETEVFRQRVLDSFQSQAFGGNQADYKEKVLAMPGVAALKVHPVWNEGIQPSALIPDAAVTTWFEATVGTLAAPVAAWLTAVYTAAKNKLLTVGGTVKLVLLAANNTAPTDTLIDDVQTAVDPTENAGEGLGLAPIGHVVKVEGVATEAVNITLPLDALMRFLLTMTGGTLTRELYDAGIEMAASLFVDRRKRVDNSCFWNLMKHFNDLCDDPATLKGYRLWAIDGSTIPRPRNPDSSNHFKSETNPKGWNNTHANLVFDILNQTFVDCYMGKDEISSRIAHDEQGALRALIYRRKYREPTIAANGG